MKKVLVLMATYNGEKYLPEQLESIWNQRKVEVSLLIRDDGQRMERGDYWTHIKKMEN